MRNVLGIELTYYRSATQHEMFVYPIRTRNPTTNADGGWIDLTEIFEVISSKENILTLAINERSLDCNFTVQEVHDGMKPYVLNDY